MSSDEKKAAAEAARNANPAIIAKRRRARADYVVSAGQVLNPDESDYRTPAVTPEEAKKIQARLDAEKPKATKLTPNLFRSAQLNRTRAALPLRSRATRSPSRTTRGEKARR